MGFTKSNHCLHMVTIFVKSCSQNQAKDDEITKLDWIHIGLARCLANVEFKAHHLKTNFQHLTTNACILIWHRKTKLGAHTKKIQSYNIIFQIIIDL